MGNVVACCPDLGHCVGIREQLEGVLERLEVARAQDDRGRSPVASQDDPLVLPFHAVHDLGEVGFDLCQRQRLRHDHVYGHP